MVRVMEVQEHKLALPLGNPQDLGETAPIEEWMVAAVLLLKYAEEEQLLWHEGRRKRRWPLALGWLLLVNLDIPRAPPRSPASYRPR